MSIQTTPPDVLRAIAAIDPIGDVRADTLYETMLKTRPALNIGLMHRLVGRLEDENGYVKMSTRYEGLSAKLFVRLTDAGREAAGKPAV